MLFVLIVCVCVSAGEVLGDMFEVSTIRREDYEFHKGKSEYEDILQCNNLPSSATPRGHQTPAAFLIMTSGLDQVHTHIHTLMVFRVSRSPCLNKITRVLFSLSYSAWTGL